VGFSIDNFANEYIVTNIVPIGLPFSISVKVGIHGVVGVEFFRYIDNESENGLFFITSGGGFNPGVDGVFLGKWIFVG
jgi:hypothetical protein